LRALEIPQCSGSAFLLKRGGCDILDVLCLGRSSLLHNSFHNTWIEYDSKKDHFKALLVNAVQENKYEWIILGNDSTIKPMNDTIQDKE
jgi:hypothetical protein